MGKDKSAKQNKKPGKLKDLLAKPKRAAALKGGGFSVRARKAKGGVTAHSLLQ